MKFASTLKLLREQNHVTQKELADYLLEKIQEVNA